MRPWHLRNPECFWREREEVELAYPELRFSTVTERVQISGTFPIRDVEGIVDRFSVLITLLPDYPESLPVVHETAGRIPHDIDRHMLSSGEACVLLPEDRWRSWPKGSSLVYFMSGPLRNFFLAQALVERGDPWPFGEWRHGLDGMRDYYREVFGTEDVVQASGFLECLASKKAKGHWNCPCKSGRRLRDCHIDLVRALREKMPRSEAVKALQHLKNVLALRMPNQSPPRAPI
jgi:hypothetical protein